jgi:hypothetical protein
LGRRTQYADTDFCRKKFFQNPPPYSSSSFFLVAHCSYTWYYQRRLPALKHCFIWLVYRVPSELQQGDKRRHISVHSSLSLVSSSFEPFMSSSRPRRSRTHGEAFTTPDASRRNSRRRVLTTAQQHHPQAHARGRSGRLQLPLLKVMIRR